MSGVLACSKKWVVLVLFFLKYMWQTEVWSCALPSFSAKRYFLS